MSLVPAASVVLPTYNRAAVLRRAIDSVLQQSEADFELIIIDDGSADETPKIVAAIEDSRVRSIRSDVNRGGNWARNRGVESARAEILSFLDSDDAYLPNRLEVMLSFFSQNPEVDVWLDSFVCRDDENGGKPDREKINPSGCTGAGFRTGIFERTISKATTAIMVRRDALFEAGLFDETLSRRQDFDMILRLSKKAICATTEKVLWVKYETRDRISSDPGTFLNAVIAICDRHPDYLQHHAAPLYRDLRSHFSRLLKQNRWKIFAVDMQRYRAHRPFEVSFLRLLFDRRVVTLKRNGRAD
jgi:glycosyltransferase involved in cell wall biosynthesis